jgi:hypothetical protein
MRSKGAQSIFLARTPLQLLICNEAQQQFGIGPNQSALVLFTDFIPSLSQVNNNLIASQWFKVHRVFFAGTKKNGPMVLLLKALGLLRLFCLTVRYKHIDTLFIGHIDDVWMRFFVKRVKAKNTVLLEDGIATLAIAARRYGSNENDPFPLHQNKPGKGFFRNNIFEERLLGNQNVTLSSLTFFTAYKSIEVNAHDRIVENRFLCLKEKAVRKQVPVNEVWFIGQPLVERGIISKKEIIALLTKVKNRWGSTNEYFYVIHRSERSPQYLNEVGYKTISFDNPIEVVLTQQHGLPRVIGSVNSSALINLLKLQNETKLFYCQLSQSFYSSRPDSRRILEYYQKHTNMDCISL